MILGGEPEQNPMGPIVLRKEFRFLFKSKGRLCRFLSPSDKIFYISKRAFW